MSRFSLLFGINCVNLQHLKTLIMDLIHIIAVVALVVIGGYIYYSKKNG